MPALILVGEPLVVDSEKVQHRRVEVVHVNATIDDIVTILIRLAVGVAGFDAAACHPH